MARSAAKSPEAFRTISEAADTLELPQHVLRFWETRFSQIKPMKRSGGRRYYRPNDIALLQGIRHLLYDEGYTIKGVQRILREQGLAHVIGVGQSHQAVMQKEPQPEPVAAPPVQTALQPQPVAQPTAPVEPAPVEPGSVPETQLPAPQPPAPQPPAPQLPASQSPAPQPALPDPVRLALGTPVSPGGSLRFVPEPDQPDPTPAPQPEAQTVAQPAIQPAIQPVPVATPVAPVPAASQSPLVPPPSAAPLPPPTLNAPGQVACANQAAAVSGALTSHQSEALAGALRTLMDCKAQLDAARAAKAPDT